MNVTAATVKWCMIRDHPFITYNPHLDRSYCRCGKRQEPGEQPADWDAKWAIFHSHPRGTSCRCYLPEQSGPPLPLGAS